jgi:hypothetical protein
MVGVHLHVGRLARSILKSLLGASPGAPELYFHWSPELGLGDHYTPSPDGLVSSVVGLGKPANGRPQSPVKPLLQEVDLVGQGGNIGELEWSQLFTPSSLELGEPAYKWTEARLVVL